MKKILTLFLGVVLLCPFFLTGCGEADVFIAVDEIVWAQSEKELMAGEFFDLDYKVYPNNASSKTIKLVDTERNAFTTNFICDKSNLVDYTIIDSDTIQIVNFFDETELTFSIKYIVDGEEKLSNCLIKKRETPESINFADSESFLSVGQTLKLLVLDNFGKELDLSRYKVTYQIPDTHKNKITVVDEGKGIIQGVSQGSFTLGLKIDFIKSQDSEGTVFYHTLETSCEINITNSYDSINIYSDGSATLASDGAIKVVSAGKIIIRFFNNNYAVKLKNCKFEANAVPGSNFTDFNTALGEGEYSFELNIISTPSAPQYIEISSSITDKNGLAFSILLKVQ